MPSTRASVSAHTSPTTRANLLSAWIEFADGCVANITASRVSKEKIRKLRVFQQDCYLSLDYASQHLNVLNRIVTPDSKTMPQLIEERPTLKNLMIGLLSASLMPMNVRTRSLT